MESCEMCFYALIDGDSYVCQNPESPYFNTEVEPDDSCAEWED